MILISYTGSFPVEIALKSRTLTLRKNTTAVVSQDEFALIKAAVGMDAKRHLVNHGEYKPKLLQPKVDKKPEESEKPVSSSLFGEKSKKKKK